MGNEKKQRDQSQTENKQLVSLHEISDDSDIEKVIDEVMEALGEDDPEHGDAEGHTANGSTFE